jgi:competence protein ComEA
MKPITWIVFFIPFAFSLFLSPVAFSANLNEKPIVSQKMVAETVNINRSDAQTMAAVLNGIGLKRAESIVAYRNENGDFKSIDDLKAVKGIGEAIIEKNKSKITL